MNHFVVIGEINALINRTGVTGGGLDSATFIPESEPKCFASYPTS
jgi:hypothetical protein